MANALVSIQILPHTPNGESSIPYVDQAIEVIQASGVPYRVGPLETTMEGQLSDLLQIVAKMNEKMIEAGCPSTLAQVKICYNPQGITMGQLTEKYDQD
ncbi:thiamine-binding protein [Risungbinella massiliensis]|uniref:thiamine-binding protein n=1 Tax=Risungbinella massiliensis TaxID=1329796 RepID=UPI0005CC0B3C|nr:MTH1187 family thiamine-binding protein [Risungbinella massiliensis]